MNILSVDTATPPHSIALSKADKILSSTLNPSAQSDSLFIEINSLLKQANINYTDLDKVLCTIGPGSFTGIRVGIAAIRGIKKTMPHLEIKGFITLELLAFLKNKTSDSDKDFHVIINAFGNEFYAQKFSSETKALSDIIVISKDHLLNQDANLTIISNDEQIIAFVKTHKMPAELLKYDATTTLEYYHNFSNHSHQVKPLYIKKPNIHPGALINKTQ